MLIGVRFMLVGWLDWKGKVISACGLMKASSNLAESLFGPSPTRAMGPTSAVGSGYRI